MKDLNREPKSKRRAAHRDGRKARLIGAAITAPLGVASFGVAHGQTLPVPCGAGTCGVAGPSAWITQGSASATLSGATLNVTQTSDSATLNWQSFNVSSDATVRFDQPSKDSVALNRIFQSDPARIFGTLNANGRVYLINQNGILFGPNAKVDVGGLIASTLDLTPAAIANGIARASTLSQPAFAQFHDATGNTLPSGAIEVQAGAQIHSDAGQVFMFAPQITNAGTISTPDGQTILAAGQSVFLATTNDPNLRGLIVEVGVGGTVTNGDPAASVAGSVGTIMAERGNVTLAGLAVNQLGRITATTSVRQNGSVRLQARADGSVSNPNPASVELTAHTGGTLTLGPGSVTEAVLAVDDPTTTVDVNTQPQSQIALEGATVNVLSGARLTATSGAISIVARTDPTQDVGTSAPNNSRIYVASDATLDVSGANTTLPMESNTVQVELRGNQLRDSPLQRNGPLRGQTVTVDIREHGVLADGTPWQGTPLADASGEISNIARDVQDRNLTGGTLSLSSAGDVLVAPGAHLNISGGSVTYKDGYVKTSQLLAADGSVVDIGKADPNGDYVSIVDGYVRKHEKWGVTEVFPGIFGTSGSQFEAGYVEGADAGSLTVVAPRFALDGQLVANVVVGPLQRDSTTNLAAGERRASSEVPLGGLLALGSASPLPGVLPNYVLLATKFDGGAALPTFVNADGTPFDPLRDPWPDPMRPSQVPTALWGQGAATRIRVYSNDSISIPSDVAFDLGPGGELSLIGAAIDFAGTLRAPGGTFAATSRPTSTRQYVDLGVDLASTATINLSGLWINDNPLLNPNGPTAPLAINGGTASISATSGAVDLENGSRILADGGAWRGADGKITAGHGGSIALAASPSSRHPEAELHVAAELRADALSDGGSLSIAANEICVADDDCTAGDPTTYWVRPDVFSVGGFASVSLSSDVRGVTFEPDTVFAVRQRNVELVGSYMLTPSGLTLDDLTRPALLPDAVRHPAKLNLRVSASLDGDPFADGNFATVGRLTLAEGSFIDADRAGSVTLRANSAIEISGTVSAPAGTISVQLDNTAPIAGFIAAQGLWLTGTGKLLAPGAVQLTPNTAGLNLGEVLDGGSVTLEADRGFVVTAPGSVIDVSGTSATLDVLENVGKYTSRTVASAGGNVSLVASEGLLAGGDIHATSGGPTVPGGALLVDLDGNLRGQDPQGGEGQEPVLPLQPRRIEVGGAQGVLVLGPGSALPTALIGQAKLSAPQIEAAGFDSIQLQAHDLVSRRFGSQFLASTGEIDFNGDVDLHATSRLELDAASFVSSGGAASLEAAYVSLGRSDRNQLSQGPAATLASGTASLAVTAQLVDLIGNSSYRGFKQISIASAGDIRVRGVQQAGSQVSRGSFATVADVALSAAQIYPTTLSDFTLKVGDPTHGVLSTSQVASDPTPATPLSAGGSLTIVAHELDHAGTLRAPLGTIAITADEVHLLPGSSLSTSLDGQVVPFGTTEIGTDWTYKFVDSTVVFDPTHAALPSQRIAVTSPLIDAQKGSVIDVAGGGDLLAYEFVPGVGGSKDVLSPLVDSNTFAILPTSGLKFAPFDTSAYDGSPIQPGNSVYLSASSGVPAGTYAMLPARYGLLPGAYLVTPMAGFEDIVPGQQFDQRSGGSIIAGRSVSAGTGLGDDRYSGFYVRPGTEALTRADYVLTGATEFFTLKAEKSESVPVRLPTDSGVLALVAEGTLNLSGTLRAAPFADGRGAQLDISGANFRVTAGGDAAAVPGQVLVSADQLNGLGADSVLIGGTRSADGDLTRLDVAAGTVSVDANAELHAPELMLVAHDSVSIGAGAHLASTAGASTSNGNLELAGDAALVRVAHGPQVEVVDTGETGATGSLLIGNGAVVSTSGSAILSASRDMVSSGRLDIAGGSLALHAAKITFGTPAAPTDGLVLPADAFQAGAIKDLLLQARTSVDFASDLNLTVTGTLTIDAPAWLLAPTLANVTLAASDIHVRSAATAAVAATPTTSGGSLTLGAARIWLEDGFVQVAGASTTSLQASDSVVAAGHGGLTIGGAASLQTGALTAMSGADYSFDAAGRFEISGNGAAATTLQSGLGARLAITADSVADSGVIRLPSGLLDITARGSAGIALAAGARIDLSGVITDFDSVDVGSPGGRATLTASTGDIAVASGAGVDVSAASNGDAGALMFAAPRGAVRIDGDIGGQAAAGFSGGELAIDASSVPSLDRVADLATAGGFNAQVAVRQRGAGDLQLTSGHTLTASVIDLVADGGAVDLSGALDAGGAAGGSVTVAGRDGVRVDGSIAAVGQAGSGGRVSLATNLGGIWVSPAARIDVSGSTDGGAVSLRAPVGAGFSMLDADATNDRLQLAGSVVGADHLDLELYTTTLDVDGSVTASDELAAPSNTLYAGLQAVAATSPAVAAALGRATDATFRILPGLEIDSAGALSVTSDWNLASWRFTGVGGRTVPGVLTLRAGGDLTLTKSLNDGFATPTTTTLTATDDSWSYRLVGGADLASPDPLAVRGDGLGDVIIAPGIAGPPTGAPRTTFVRTGNGRVDVEAGRDFVLSNAFSTLYTAGVATTGLTDSALGNRLYPDHGGDIAIHAGRDIVGAQSTQLMTAWLWRVGQGPDEINPRRTAWTVAFDQFAQGVGALGGGNIDVDAGRNIVELSAVIPTSGRPVAVAVGGSVLQIAGGGDLSVSAAGDIYGGSYYVGKGDARISAGGSVGAGPAGIDPALGLSDGTIKVASRSDLQVAAVIDPMLLTQPVAQRVNALQQSYFLSYAPTARVDLTSIAGDVTLFGDPAALEQSLTSVSLKPGDAFSFALYPPTLRAAALRGDVLLNGSATLAPAPKGNLELFAYDDVRAADREVQVMLSDADPALLPTAASPDRTWNGNLGLLTNALAFQTVGFFAPTPNHSLASQPDGVADATPVRLVALTGDIRSDSTASDNSAFVFAKPARLVAGRDITNVRVIAQNLDDTDVTSLVAGRDISYPVTRDPATGSIEPNVREIRVDGPGRLELVAGRNVALEASAGVLSAGNVFNSALPGQGSDVSITAGVAGHAADFAAFTDRYLANGSTYDKDLIAYVEEMTGQTGLSKADALTQFAALDRTHQAALIEAVFFAELRAGGRQAASSVNADFSRAFAALETLFPGSNPDVEAGQSNAYSGDISTFFSRVYTIDGGNIALIAPGGAINAGIATPPAAFGVAKGAANLGIVAQSTGSVDALAYGDFAVNESRVFAADGGNILVWSTRGDIDAGRGAKTAISAPPPTITFDENGALRLVFPAALTGSGIQTLATSEGKKPGDVDLFAPRGVVNAGDAGIVAGNLTIAATAVLGADNIKVSGTAVGVPVDTGGLGAALTGVSAVAASAANTAEQNAAPTRQQTQSETPLAAQALGFLDIFVTGFGEGCDPKDPSCSSGKTP
jgi:filamentous hemagglutinin family protein